MRKGRLVGVDITFELDGWGWRQKLLEVVGKDSGYGKVAEVKIDYKERTHVTLSYKF